MAEKDMGRYSSLSAALEAILKNHPKIKNYETPWWGDKVTQSGNMINRGYVIGFRDQASSAQWRLDCDPAKMLHINWTQEFMGQETIKECYRIATFVRSPEDTMFDYYIGWTKRRHESIPPAIKSRLDSNGVTSWNGRMWIQVQGQKS